MQVKKTLKIPVHYDTTKVKMDILDKLTARITYCIGLISELITQDTKVDRQTIRKLVKVNHIAAKTGLSAGFVDQCIDKVKWSWESYKELHGNWENKVKRAQERIASSRDEKEKEKAEKSLQKLIKKEPSRPLFQNKNKIPCRIDYRTGEVQQGKGKLTPW